MKGFVSRRGESRRRGYCPALELLETRLAPAGIPINIVVKDPNNLFAAAPLLLSSLQAAGQILSSLIGGQGSLEVAVMPNNSIPRASGGSAIGVPAGTDAQGNTIVRDGTLAEALTGIDPNGSDPDILININVSTYLSDLYFDPSGVARTGQVPFDKTDFISIALHEMMHSLGISSFRHIDGPNYGKFTDTYRAVYDGLTSFGSGNTSNVLYFTGKHAQAVYGGPVPLTSVGPNHFLSSQNFSHVGNPEDSNQPGADLIPDLMNGVVFYTGSHYFVSQLDMAILQDLGWQAIARAGLGQAVNLVEISKQFTYSTEYFRNFLARAFNTYVNRSPDDAEYKFFLDNITGGARFSDEHIEALFIGAPEYIQKKGGTDAKWISSMYKDLLFRDPRQDELDYWTGRLTQLRNEHSGDASYNANVQAAEEFDTSDEREGYRVQGNYQAYLSRQANKQEVDYWVGQFRSGGQTSEDLAAGFIGSHEYFISPTKGRGDRASWVRSVYRDVLGRVAGDADIAFWISQMD